MNILTAVLTVALAVIIAAAGIPKILSMGSAPKNAEHHGIPTSLNRAIGILELCATAGLLGGFVVEHLAVAAAAGVSLLIIGALITHIRVKDPMSAMIPALVVETLALAVLALQIAS